MPCGAAAATVPEGMPVTQVVEAISRGVIDGTTGHPISMFDFGISRVANNHYLGKIGTVTLGIFMNKAKFDSLPPQAKAAIESNRGEACDSWELTSARHGGRDA